MADAFEVVHRGPVNLVTANQAAPLEFASLPRPLTSLFGRDQAAKAVAALLRDEDVRLLTLTSPGGVGKTHLALHVAADLANDFPAGVAFVDLSPIIDPELVILTIAHAVGLRVTDMHPLLQRLARFFEDQRLLLVVDNFEQVAEAARSIATLLADTSEVKMLVTSRVPLRVAGEQEFAVQPLQALDPDATFSVDLDKNPAVALFIQQARAVKADFVLNETNAPTVVEICRQLDGLPLAIKLAASRSKILTPEALLRRLSPALSLLAGRTQDQPARLRTMRDAIAWSYDLLSPAEQALFRRLGVFTGGFTLEAADIIVGNAHGSPPSPDPLDSIAALVDHSLLQAGTDSDGEPRFTMLETIRAYTVEQLEVSGEAESARRQQVNWCLALATQASAAFQGRGPGLWGKRLAQEIDNVRAALAWLSSTGDIKTLLRLATTLAPLWSSLGHEREGYSWLTCALERSTGVPAVVVTRASILACRLATALDNFPAALSLAQDSAIRATETGDAQVMADAHCLLGNIARGLGDDALARSQYEDALARYRDLGDHYNIGYTLIQLAKLGDLGTIKQPGNLADQALAEARCEEALSLYRELGNTGGIARALHQRAYVAYKRRDHPRAADLSRDALALRWEDHNLTDMAASFEDLADIAGMTGEATAAARLYGVAEQLREVLGAPMWPAYRDEYELDVAVTRQALPPDRFAEEWAAGRSLPLADAVTDALGIVDAIATRSSAPSIEPTSTFPGPDHGLTGRELEVLRLIAAGHSNRVIADALFIGVPTVKGHVSSIMSKLVLDSRTAVAAYAHRNGLA